MSSRNGSINVSIVIVNWNVAALLDSCLRSIQRESSRCALTIEVIVIDNASDGRDVVEVVARYPEARLVELPENHGYGTANNVGIGLAQGRAVFILNPDTELLPGSLARLWDTLNLSSHIGLVAPMLLNPDRTIQSSGYRFPGAANVFFDLFPAPDRLYGSALNGRVSPGNGELPVRIDYALGAALFARREALLDVGMFDERYFMYSEEIDLQRRLSERGWTCLLAPDAHVIHHGGQSTAQRADEMQLALWASRAQYFRRWNSPGSRRFIRALVSMGTRLQDRRYPRRRAVNRRIRDLFRNDRDSRS